MSPVGGAVAYGGTVSLTPGSADFAFGRYLHKNLRDNKGMSIGEAVMRGKQSYFNRSYGGGRVIVLGWTLLGFPELTIN